MPGTLVRDANASNLLTGATLNSAGTTNGTGVEVNRPGDVELRVTFGTVTGTTPTFTATLQSSDDSGFASGNVTHGTIGPTSGTGAAQTATTRQIQARVYKRYVRLLNVVLGGTSPVYTGSTAYLEQREYFRGTPTSTTDTAT